MGKFGEIDSADMHAGKFPLVPMGAERRVPRAQTREQGPPSALAEIDKISCVRSSDFDYFASKFWPKFCHFQTTKANSLGPFEPS